MPTDIRFVIQHGYGLIFGVVFAEQVGLPIPSTPLLLAAGAMIGLGQLRLAHAWALAVAACLLADLIWYVLGRWKGNQVLAFFCRVSLEPDICELKTRVRYKKFGVNWLLFAKFIPGISTIIPPMAGMFKVAPLKFIFADAIGSALWSGAYLGIGWVFRSQLQVAALYLAHFGSSLLAVAALALAVYIGLKVIRRRRILRDLRVARISPAELKGALEAGVPMALIDMRNPAERLEGSIPGSITPAEKDIEVSVPLFELDEVVLYCSCPDELTSARVALKLKRRGVGHVRPLEGGFPKWKALRLPIERLERAVS